jgi:hypothetical protein
MPFRIDPDKYPDRTKIAFTTMTGMPSLIHTAAEATGCASNTEYINRALCRALGADLCIDEESLLDRLPPFRWQQQGAVPAHEHRTSSAGTVEEVR